MCVCESITFCVEAEVVVVVVAGCGGGGGGGGRTEREEDWEERSDGFNHWLKEGRIIPVVCDASLSLSLLRHQLSQG